MSHQKYLVRKNPGKKPPKYVEYEANTPEQRAEIRRIATEYAEKHGLKVTITDIEVHPPAGGGIAVEHREIKGKPVIAIFGKNGGRFGENPLTEDEYEKKSKDFLSGLRCGQRYTSIHGDHRLYYPGGTSDTCYGQHYDRRVIERMAREGLISPDSVDLERVRCLDHSTDDGDANG